ncbi:MAG: hypothetical protein RSD88_08270 [Anaerovoracaceae bacterium]
MIQRLLINAKNERITVLDVMKDLHGCMLETGSFQLSAEQLNGEKTLNLEEMVSSFEKNILKYACTKYGSTRKAVRAIGISQTQLVRKKKKYEL